MIDSKHLRADVQSLLTCAPLECPQEEKCFRVARALLALLPERVLDEPKLNQDTVMDYAPDWSAS